ncbi:MULTISPECIES: helix-turn-helix transcriptional regulator [Lactobacillaceae]|uniref:XRE family transcriptional regulator n=1 Tax=Ligilactobacillus murinus TaxID=1622 RepID=A0A4S2EM58_9LACO|nr:MULTISPECIES: helix-turn-helix transcriptional regulator [Lactobacillaceae]MBX9011874.1 helix-turn-helix transcriptional regulator [Ligilactobacillus murinus]TGY57238.1 XRE family transcriptional regulator [Ligilactobacillus murinus]
MSLVDERKELGLTQQEAARRIGITQSMLAMLENGTRKGTDETKVKVAKFYNKSIDSLFFDNLITKSN